MKHFFFKIIACIVILSNNFSAQVKYLFVQQLTFVRMLVIPQTRVCIWRQKTWTIELNLFQKKSAKLSIRLIKIIKYYDFCNKVIETKCQSKIRAFRRTFYFLWLIDDWFLKFKAKYFNIENELCFDRFIEVHCEQSIKINPRSRETCFKRVKINVPLHNIKKWNKGS